MWFVQSPRPPWLLSNTFVLLLSLCLIAIGGTDDNIIYLFLLWICRRRSAPLSLERMT